MSLCYLIFREKRCDIYAEEEDDDDGNGQCGVIVVSPLLRSFTVRLDILSCMSQVGVGVGVCVCCEEETECVAPPFPLLCVILSKRRMG